MKSIWMSTKKELFENGKVVIHNKTKDDSVYYPEYIDFPTRGKRTQIGKVLLHLFKGLDYSNTILRYKDGDSNNKNIENLELLPKVYDNLAMYSLQKYPIDSYITTDDTTFKVVTKHVAVSKEGYVLNMYTGKASIGNKTKKGYMKVSNGEHKTLVHRLVAKAFIPNPDNLETVNHINENKEDNRVENLEWKSRLDNAKEYHNLREHRLVKLLDTKTKELSKAKAALLKERRALTSIKKELSKTVKALEAAREKAESVTAMHQLAISSHQTYMERRKLTSENASIGKPLKVNGVEYRSIKAAARYIASCEPTKNVDTIRKELRKFLNGDRPEWSMYGKYAITSV